MTTAIEASQLIRRAVEPRGADESAKALITRAARLLGVGFGRAKAIWYREARVIRAEEMDRLRMLANRRKIAEEAASHEFDEFRARLGRMEAAYRAIDPDFFVAFRDAVRSASRDGE